MKEEQIAWKKAHIGEKKVSMKRRDDHHDYSERRIYMITLEIEGRQPLFGHLEGDPFAPTGSADSPHIELSALGQAVRDEWMGIPRYFPQIEVKGLQMMPDHLHGILFVKERLSVHLGQVISGFKAGCRKIQRRLEGEKEIAAEPQPTEKSNAQPTEKGEAQVAGKAVSQQVAALSPYPPLSPLFAKGYNDLILRSYDELGTWLNYLHDNPRRLMLKRARPEWLRPFFQLPIGSYLFSGIGNRSLLQAPKRIAVRVSRRLSGAALDNEVQRYLDEARNGAILVSPAISPGEKRTMREAFNAGLPTIVIMENGFTPLSKPHGEQFYACAQGKLLMLSAWEHHNDKRKLTAEQCRQLNLMALSICE